MAGEHARRDAYERLYAEYRRADHAFVEARARAASKDELRRLQRRVHILWALLASWRREE